MSPEPGDSYRFIPQEGEFYTQKECMGFAQAEIDSTIRIQRPGELSSVGGGIIVTGTEGIYLATAAHVLYSMFPGQEYSTLHPRLEVQYRDSRGNTHTQKLSKKSILYNPRLARKMDLPWGDLAIIKWEHGGFSVDTHRFNSTDIGRSVVCTGFPYSERDKWESSSIPLVCVGTVGRVSNLSTRGFLDTIELDIKVDGGNSGGGIFVEDKLVAISSQGGNGATAILIADILDQVESKLIQEKNRS